MLEKLTAGDFEEHIGSTFSLSAAPDGPQLTLVEVERGQRQPNAPRTEPFGLLFTSETRSRLDQGTYALEHPAMGQFELFLVPIGPDQEGQRFEAIFN